MMVQFVVGRPSTREDLLCLGHASHRGTSDRHAVECVRRPGRANERVSLGRIADDREKRSPIAIASAYRPEYARQTLGTPRRW